MQIPEISNLHESIEVDAFLKSQPLRTLILDIVLQNGIYYVELQCKITAQKS